MLLSKIIPNAPDIEIKALAYDSRLDLNDSIFFCLKGASFNGHDFVKEAISKGAKVIVYSDDIKLDDNAIYIKVKSVETTMAYIASKFYDNPSSKLKLIGVTGTNGKTTITSIINDLISNFSSCAYIGTLGINYNDKTIPATLTTPDIISINKYLADFQSNGIKYCAMEVSSIGLEQKRVFALDFDYAIFSNLSHDHLDYHINFDNYLKAKKILFDSLSANKVAIINIDDENALNLITDCKAKVITYGIDKFADFMAMDINCEKDHSTFTLKALGTIQRVRTNLVGRFNIYNLLAAYAMLTSEGYDLNKLINLSAKLNQIKGRMERIDNDHDYNIIIDYAHTPDGLNKVFEYAKKITDSDKKIIAITGSAGRRDKLKRAVFGEILDTNCDMIILTEDDPRDEKVSDICLEIASSIKNHNYVIIESRAEAIVNAMEIINKGDCLLILGKGSEKFMYRNNTKEAYEGDEFFVRRYLKEMENDNEIS